MRTRLLLSLVFMTGFCVGQTYTYSTLVNFPATSKKGPAIPQDLIIDSSGNLYGVSAAGGVSNFGTVFKVTPKGVLTVLHSFTGADGNLNGGLAFPNLIVSNVTRDSKGNIYGAAPFGGTTDPHCYQAGCGTVYKLTAGKNGAYTFGVLYYSGPGEQYPQGITVDGQGNLFFSSTNGGLDAINCDGNGAGCGAGELLELAAPGYSLSDLHDFCVGADDFCQDGAFPISNAIIRGNTLYGVTWSGGFFYGSTGAEDGGCGVIYSWSTEAGYDAPLHTFTDGDQNGNGFPNDGCSPLAKLTQDSSGNLFGTTFLGGATASSSSSGLGTIFKMDASGNYSVLYSFCQQSSCPDGSNPNGPIVLDSGGNMYGTAGSGGTNGHGTVFKFTPNGQFTVLYNGATAGVGSGLVMDKSGNLYGFTFDGGPSHNGSIYKLTRSN